MDGLRAVAVALVFVHHAFPTYLPGGFLGVDIFFVISGFVITGALMRDGIDFRRFYIHRFFRIIPPVLPVLAFVLLVSAAGFSLASNLHVVASMFSFMNWLRVFDSSGGEYLGHFWSLSIEEQFYLLWPALLAALIAFKLRPALAISVLLVASLTVQLVLFATGASVERIYNGLDTRASQLLIGCLLYFLVDRVKFSQSYALAALAALLCGCLFVGSESDFYLTAGIGIAGVLSALVVGNLAQQQAAWHKLLQIAPMQWGGSRSYAVYLWHFPLLGLFKAMAIPNAIGAAFALAATCFAAEVSMRLVERPARALRDRIDASSARAA
ncbi:MAG: acyltransferase [Pseudomonadota bacterium]